MSLRNLKFLNLLDVKNIACDMLKVKKKDGEDPTNTAIMIDEEIMVLKNNNITCLNMDVDDNITQDGDPVANYQNDTDPDTNNYPIGSVIIVEAKDVDLVPKNTLIEVYRTTEANQIGYTTIDTGPSFKLAGQWRSRGISGISGNDYALLAQRAV
jgi:hypothetical protein